ncbi:5-methyltetrahydropteroyltriglutamate--homocysteine S-methyltransferase [Emticicia sp. 21SJ11W-3]|uniref:5-methyltetrahydropteroyltriglutamate-- homocysteine S-methyltransferase n=1 Tax=Emticicia sp. 21SJ11W-3 TaxID=2916755 RepID=UPI00209F3770|nr:5-methyltetrahydropteroyltriglutamate--homocysteine S-methyltransferase [Emticicia sp. 21SJ11W-3]UTA70320.1 5-methyltetrahydropteroyltriglutamate--homocysteine S-methyltransferase [Emticicia sp. 21SJ11W-3]
MFTHNLGYPRIGNKRELKKACEAFWAGKITKEELLDTGRQIRLKNWLIQTEAGIELVPSNDFSLYDQVLDMSLMLGAIPTRYHSLQAHELELYFAMARGVQKDGMDISAMEMTKWFDTNYHYIVPEFVKNQQFSNFSKKAIEEFEEAREQGFLTKPVLIGPVSYLLLGKEKQAGFNKIDLLETLLPVYLEILKELSSNGAEWMQIDEPYLVMDLSEEEKRAFAKAYQVIRKAMPEQKLLLATYFEDLGNNLMLTLSLPVDALHIDLARAPQQLEAILSNEGFRASEKILSLGIVDGRNIWKNNFTASLALIKTALQTLGANRVAVAPSCSLLHVPCDLAFEKDEESLPAEIKNWLAFATQKLWEVGTLAKLAGPETTHTYLDTLTENQQAIRQRRESAKIHKTFVKERLGKLNAHDFNRKSNFESRQKLQWKALNLPVFPTTTIGSFPQTLEIRKLRVSLKKGEISPETYEKLIEEEIGKAISWQEDLGIDVLVHGEFERNDMVEYFGEQLSGYVFTQNGWVQSYGSRCVKPPVIYGDIERPQAMTVRWSAFAQSKTRRLMKGMLTGPVTILQWSFVRDDQPRSQTAFQIALAIRDEVVDLEKAGIKVIQIDEPAIREGLPLRKSKWEEYLKWAVNAFRLSAAGVKDETQIHTHMCYSEFNDIISSIAAMDADVITIETSRSQMELLKAFADFKYPNEIGPGVYDIHSPRIPTVEEMVSLLDKALEVIPARNLWVNPDCGLKTRGWQETEEALKNMIEAAKRMRRVVQINS